MVKSYADSCLERADKATEGPWKPNQMYHSWGDGTGDIAATGPMKRIQPAIEINTPDLAEQMDADAEFIAHARTDVPELARRLKLAVKCLRQWAEMSPELKSDYLTLAKDLESPLEDK